MLEGRNVYKILMGKAEGKRALGRPKRSLKNGIRMDLKETDSVTVDWIQSVQDRDRWQHLVTGSGTIELAT
jgi:hypothetical protein